MRILSFPDPADGAGPQGAPQGNGGSSSAPDPAPGAQGAPPEAAETVLGGTLAESDAAELVELRRRQAESQKALRDRETRIAELEDENRQLKTVPRHETKSKKSWLEGGTFFG